MYWIAVASKEHVNRGITGGFCQVCHGNLRPLKQMTTGDWIVYYSPTERFGEKMPYRKFTAIGRIKPKEPYQHRMGPDFVPWRRDVAFLSSKEISIELLINKLSFIHNKQHWGLPFRKGCFPIPLSDFQLIASNMGILIS
jgi:hypothetical protein